MIKSMTGYGKASAEVNQKKITVEIKSLNSKGLDASVKTSSLFREKELEIRKTVGAGMVRGKVEVALFTESLMEEQRNVLNQELGRQYYQQLKSLAEAIDNPPADYLSIIARMPDMYAAEKQELTAEEWTVAQQVLKVAMENHDAFRTQEGEHLQADLTNRISAIEALEEQIAALAADRKAGVRAKLTEALAQIEERERADDNRFEQELIYYLEKLDITEELVRLKGHCNYFVETLAEEAGQGKKLGFIGQEIGREINTIGSKANHVEIQRLVVQMKDELEKIKEQILNIL